MGQSTSKRLRKQAALCQSEGLVRREPGTGPDPIPSPALDPTPPPMTQPLCPPGSLPVRLCPDGSGVIVTTSTGREIWLLPTESGFETLVKLLDIESRRAAGQWDPQAEVERRAAQRRTTQHHDWDLFGKSVPPTRRFDTRGRQEVTLADLGL